MREYWQRERWMDRIVRRSAQMWAEVLARFADSGLSALQFCEQEGINIKSFARWRTRLTGPAESAPAKRASPVPKAKPGFIDLGTMPVDELVKRLQHDVDARA